MMTVEPTCRFCKRKLTVTNVKGGYKEPQEFICWCEACQSEQVYNDKARAIYWSFEINHKYRVQFWAIPGEPQCSIFLLANGGKEIDKCLLSIDFIPYLTPQNTTEERIKLFLVFS